MVIASDEPHKFAALEYFNAFLGRSENTFLWERITKDLEEDFSGLMKLQPNLSDTLSEDEKNMGLQALILQKKLLANIVERVVTLTGIGVNETIREDLRNFPETFEFLPPDIVSLQARVCSIKMGILSFSLISL